MLTRLCDVCFSAMLLDASFAPSGKYSPPESNINYKKEQTNGEVWTRIRMKLMSGIRWAVIRCFSQDISTTSPILSESSYWRPCNQNQFSTLNYKWRCNPCIFYWVRVIWRSQSQTGHSLSMVEKQVGRATCVVLLWGIRCLTDLLKKVFN